MQNAAVQSELFRIHFLKGFMVDPVPVPTELQGRVSCKIVFEKQLCNWANNHTEKRLRPDN